MSSDSYPSLFGAWTRASSQLFTSVLEANRATLSAFSLPPLPADERCTADGVTAATTTGAGAAATTGAATASTPAEDRITPAGDLPEWEVELDADGSGLAVGDAIRFTKTLTEADVERFAAASGDTNPLHLDEGFAADTRFGGRIVHGTLVSGLISAALARLPGGIVYLSQDLQFLKPVRIGDRVTAAVEAVEHLGGNRFRLTTQILDHDDEVIIDGEATILVEAD